MPDHRRDQFVSWDAIRDLGAITIVVPDVLYYIDKAARARAARHPQDPIAGRTAAAHYGREGGRGVAIRVPLGFPIGKRDERFASFVNTWITLKRKAGTLDAAYKHWILGQDAAPRQPRWSIVRNVLHWE